MKIVKAGKTLTSEALNGEFIVAEYNRDNAEQKRRADEIIRKTNEQNRVTVESQRVILFAEKMADLENTSTAQFDQRVDILEAAKIDHDSKLSDHDTKFTIVNNNIGNRQYTQKNYIQNSENLTASINKLDIAIKGNKTTFDEHLVNYSNFVDQSNSKNNEINSSINKNTLNINSRGINVMQPPIPLMPPTADGITDDSARFQAIIDLDLAVFVPKGTYKIKNTVDLKNNDFLGVGIDTKFDIDGCDGFRLMTSDGRKITEIGKFRVICTTGSCDNYCAFISEQKLNSPGVGYKIHHIEIGGQGRFGGGFLIYDMFRLDISHVGMTDVMNAVMLVGQVVQATLNDITSNCGSFLNSTPTTVNGGKKSGLYVGGSSHNGMYQLPESIKVSNCSFVGHYYGVYQQDCLFSVYDKMDLDYCKKVGVFVSSAGGGFNFKNSWIAMDGAQICYGIQIETPNFDPHPIKIEGVHISFLSSVNPESIGIFVSDSSNAGRHGVKIIDNTIKGSPNTIKHGIFFNRTKKFICSGNIVFDNCCTNQEIYLSWTERFTCDNNIANRLYIHSDNSYYECRGNHVNTYTLTGNSIKHTVINGVVGS